MDIYSRTKRSKIMSSVRNNRTSPENTIYELVKKYGLRIERNPRQIIGAPDIVLPYLKKAIFINGCFWHGHKGCNRATIPQSNTLFWNNKIALNKKRDRKVMDRLRQSGWEVKTVWQCELKNLSRVDVKLRDFIFRE